MTGTVKRKKLILAILGAPVFLVVIVLYSNRLNRTVTIEPVMTDPAGPAALRGLDDASITVTIWNLGYGGLGAESDFVADGGESFLPPSRSIVDKNIEGIVSKTAAMTSDVILIQEAARRGPLTRGADLVGALASTFSARDNAFSPDVVLRVAPGAVEFRHGLFSSAKLAGVRREIVPLPLEPAPITHFARRLYHMHVLRVPYPGGEWSLVNLHLSAFDDGAEVRRAQLRAALKFAQDEYGRGNHVVMGGDWNYEFAQPGRPSTTAQADLFWIHSFPAEELPQGWRAAFDPATPSVRTNERPYRKGENYTTVIDGFIVSPNVIVDSVATRDLDFQFADHQPVTGVFHAAASVSR